MLKSQDIGSISKITLSNPLRPALVYGPVQHDSAVSPCLYSAFNAPLANLVDMVYISDELIISQKTVNSSFLLLQLFSQDYFYSFFILEIELLSIAIFSFIVQLKSNKKFISV